MKIIILGTAFPFRGGIASFNERMARELISMGHEVIIYTFTLQYPAFLFPGKTQFSDSEAPKDLKIIRSLNSVNPVSWILTGLKIRREKPELIISKFWLPFMGPALGTSKRIAKTKKTKAVSIIDNIIPHEKRPGDFLFSKYFAGSIDKFVVMSSSVQEDMKQFTNKKPVIFAPHPVYDNYGEILSKTDACKFLNLDSQKKYIIFFGFIRDYKGLDLLFHAINDDYFRKTDIKCIVAGEYYGNEEKYNSLIDELNIRDILILKTDFIPDNEVRYFFCAADLVVQPYKTATQSGISQLAYHFERPMVVTDVGGLAEIVENGKAGYVVEPEPLKIKEAIIEFFEKDKSSLFSENLKKRKMEFSWKNFVMKILN
jgi:glycosyltransferase involved in cell wall biosynthesis